MKHLLLAVALLLTSGIVQAELSKGEQERVAVCAQWIKLQPKLAAWVHGRSPEAVALIAHHVPRDTRTCFDSHVPVSELNARIDDALEELRRELELGIAIATQLKLAH